MSVRNTEKARVEGSVAADMPAEERRARLVFSMLLPVVRLSRRFGISLADLTRWLRMAYFQELRSQGLTLKESCEVMGVSVPTAARLSRQLKTNFFAPERQHQLPQRIEFMLWAEGLSRARIHQCLPGVPNRDIDAALSQMVEEGRLQVEGERETFVVVKGKARLVGSAWSSRIGSLNSLLDNLSDTVWRRLVLEQPEAFARTLNFRVREEDLPRLRALYEEVVWPHLVSLDEKARNWRDRRDVKLSIFWAPQDDDSKQR